MQLDAVEGGVGNGFDAGDELGQRGIAVGVLGRKDQRDMTRFVCNSVMPGQQGGQESESK